MKTTPYKTLATVTLLALTAAGCDKKDNGAGQGSSSSTVPAAPNADNTKTNTVDRNGTAKTPMDQGNNRADIDITAAIRRGIIEDKTMSTNAQNCKIISEKGVVTLRGVVDSQAEKDAIGAKAKATAGVVSVDNQLEIKKAS
jgi:hyperosmotically inducible protein